MMRRYDNHTYTHAQHAQRTRVACFFLFLSLRLTVTVRRVWLIELNDFARTTSSSLFDWTQGAFRLYFVFSLLFFKY